MAWLFVAGDTDPGNRLTAWSFTTGSHNLETQLVERTIQQAEPDLHNTVSLCVPRAQTVRCSMRLPGREREMNRPQRRAVRRGETDILGAIHLNLVVSRRLECVG